MFIFLKTIKDTISTKKEMDKVSKAIKCVNCKQILSSPVILPCGHSICEKHVRSAQSIQCGKCGLEHKVPQSGRFPTNEPLSEIIETKIEALNLGQHHSNAREACKLLQDELKLVNLILNDPNTFTYEVISELENRVDLKREKLKVQIDDEANILIDKLKDYKTRCSDATKGINVREKHSAEANELEEAMKLAEGELDTWQSVLNKVDRFDEREWDKIKEDSEEKFASIREKMKNVKSELLLKEFEDKVALIDPFERINIDSL